MPKCGVAQEQESRKVRELNQLCQLRSNIYLKIANINHHELLIIPDQVNLYQPKDHHQCLDSIGVDIPVQLMASLSS